MVNLAIFGRLSHFWQFWSFSEIWSKFQGVLKVNLALWQSLVLFANFAIFGKVWWILGKFGGYGKCKHLWQIWQFLLNLVNFGTFGQKWQFLAILEIFPILVKISGWFEGTFCLKLPKLMPRALPKFRPKIAKIEAQSPSQI